MDGGGREWGRCGNVLQLQLFQLFDTEEGRSVRNWALFAQASPAMEAFLRCTYVSTSYRAVYFVPRGRLLQGTPPIIPGLRRNHGVRPLQAEGEAQSSISVSFPPPATALLGNVAGVSSRGVRTALPRPHDSDPLGCGTDGQQGRPGCARSSSWRRYRIKACIAYVSLPSHHGRSCLG